MFEEPRERVVGYDAREMWLSFESTWPERRKEQFLYRRDIVKPLSVDTKVWPSIFVSEQRRVPRERFGYQSSWADLNSLRQTLTALYREQPLHEFRIIAITLLLGSYSQEDHVDWDHMIPPVAPDQRGPNWAFLGYDVADKWMLSALMNCGFMPQVENVAALKKQWGPLLNQFHLFTDLGSAISFKRMSDERLKNDHAPCFVFGLWAVK